MSLNEHPHMYVNVTHEELDEITVLSKSDRRLAGDTSKLAARLKELSAKNGGNFDHRMALLGVITDIRVTDGAKKAITFDLTSLPLQTKVKEHFFGNDKV